MLTLFNRAGLLQSRKLGLYRSDQGYRQKRAYSFEPWKYKGCLSVSAQKRLQKKTDRITRVEAATSTRIVRCLVNPFKKFTIADVRKKLNEISSRYKFSRYLFSRFLRYFLPIPDFR